MEFSKRIPRQSSSLSRVPVIIFSYSIPNLTYGVLMIGVRVFDLKTWQCCKTHKLLNPSRILELTKILMVE